MEGLTPQGRRFRQLSPFEKTGVAVRLASEWSGVTCLMALCLSGVLLLGALGAVVLVTILQRLN